jgi:aconitate hydratase
MVAIESTPEMAAAVYATMARNLAVVRRRLGKPLTLADKILLGHLDDPEHQEIEPGKSYLQLRPDRVVFQDVLGQTGLLQFMQTRRKKSLFRPPFTATTDPGAGRGRLGSARIARGEQGGLRLSAFGGGQIWPGLLGAGRRDHPPSCAGELCVPRRADHRHRLAHTQRRRSRSLRGGVGGADAVEVIAGLPWEELYPRHIAVYLTGQMSGWTAPKDVILYVAGELTVSGATNAIVEYIGPGARTISATGKATITNMGAELGATTSLFPADERMAKYLRATGKAALVPLVQQNQHLLEPDKEVEADPAKYYDRVVELDLSKLEPHIVGPHSPDRARPISRLAAEVADPSNGFVDEISTALIGSCTNSSYEDMSRAADVAEQAKAHGLKAAVPFLVTPGSEQVRATIERDGQMQSLKDIDGTVLANACGPCIGQWRRAAAADAAPNTIVTSYNRNFPRRNDGSPTTMNFIGSPEIVTAFALAKRLSFNPLTDTLTDAEGKAFRLDPPKPAPEVPARDFDRGQATYVAPPEDGGSIQLQVDPKSERLQLMEPWSAWDGRTLWTCRS